jgi:2,3-di-O-geranylgeranylglyceryl phosphate reductase (EC 1.3.99.-)
MSSDAYDIVVVGGGTAGVFAAATAATEGLDVVIVERKSKADAGHIACGDAIKGKSTFPDVIDLEYLKDESFTNREISRAVFENPADGKDIEIEFSEPGAVLDRKRYGEVLLEEAKRVGSEIHYNTVVQDVIQADDGTVTGVIGTRKGEAVNYDAEVVIDAAGALSILQEKRRSTVATLIPTSATHSSVRPIGRSSMSTSPSSGTTPSCSSRQRSSAISGISHGQRRRSTPA